MHKRSAGHAGNKEQTPCGFVTLHTPRVQKAGACASEAKGMRETWQGGGMAAG